jgi:plasmid stabilization system protein ParE
VILNLIFDHLLETFLSLGDALPDAMERAERRVVEIEDHMDVLGRAPFQGTLSEDLMPGLRHVTKNRAVYYFVADNDAMTVNILAVFFGGQDHQRHMLTRLLSRE